MGTPQSGDVVPVIVCRHCGYTMRVLGVPGDDQGKAFQTFRHKCTKCEKEDDYQLTDIRPATAHRKH